MVLLSVVIPVILCLFVSSAHEIDEIKVFSDESDLDFSSVEEEITKISESEYDVTLQETVTACDCGPNSKGCKIENSTKICKCEPHYRQVNGFCKDWCDEEHQTCENGGICENESCQCLPGTSGGFCKTVDACEGIKGPLLCGDPDTVLCRYNVKKQEPYCMCRHSDYLYYSKVRGCIRCNCGGFGSCTLVDGKKTCNCYEGAAVRKVRHQGEIEEICDACNCGSNSHGCSFDGIHKICHCNNGFVHSDSCKECNCGPNGQCYFRGLYQHCICDDGYKPFQMKNSTNYFCEACDCGKNGECSFSEEVKQCRCHPGYASRNGVCTACQCYVGNETVQCTFTDKIQKCLCPNGYEETKFFCQDIDECLNSSNSCPSTTDCLNTMGSYECVCKEGYALVRNGSDPKVEGCEDINECENEELCPRNHTICHNFPGSYNCTCEKGYVPVPPNLSPKDSGCEKEKEKADHSSPGRTGLIVMGVILSICLCVIGMLAVIFVKRRSARRPALRTDTIMEDID